MCKTKLGITSFHSPTLAEICVSPLCQHWLTKAFVLFVFQPREAQIVRLGVGRQYPSLNKRRGGGREAERGMKGGQECQESLMRRGQWDQGL